MKQTMERFFERIYADNDDRVVGKRDIERDRARYRLNESLRQRERELVDAHYQEDIPAGFVVGAPRSGTTLLSQLIVESLDVGFVTNEVAQYWMAPIHALEQQRGRPGAAPASGHRSFLGATQGAGSIHEFGYFWQRWLDHRDSDELDARQRAAVDWAGLRGELLGMAGFLKKKLLMKNIVYTDYLIEELSARLPGAFFINIEREPAFVIQSIYEARVRRYGDAAVWWSIRPGPVAALGELEILEQIAHQYFYTRRAVRESLGRLPPSAHVTVRYEELAAAPGQTLERIGALLGEALVTPPDGESVRSSNRWRLSPARREGIERAVAAVAPRYGRGR